MNKECRVLVFGDVEVRESEGEAAKIVGTALRYGKLSDDLGGFREKFKPGAFGDLDGSDVIATIHHDTRQLLGRTPKTLRLTDTNNALRYEVDVPDTSSGRDAVELIGRGDIRGSSFTFRIKAGGQELDEQEDGSLIRTVTKAELFEVAPVVSPAYPQTDTSVAQRSIDAWRREILAAKAERFGEAALAEVELREREVLL